MQGKEGVVNVQWRLNAEALYDFVDPLAGTVMFGQVNTIFSGLMWLIHSMIFHYSLIIINIFWKSIPVFWNMQYF